jgi:hypothetical protein
MVRRSAAVVASIIPALVAGMMLSAIPALAQTAPAVDVPSVGVQPVGSSSTDPNAGSWFISQAVPGQVVSFKARVANTAPVAQIVTFSIADIQFSSDGTPFLPKTNSEVGTWGQIDPPSVTLGPQSVTEVPFSVTVPKNADPGDHVGAFVASSQPTTQPAGAHLTIIKRVATRMYITVPGDVQPSISIAKVNIAKDSAFYPHTATVTVFVRNSGRIRVAPTVTVNGHRALGSDLLVSQSVEHYVATVKIPAWGGPQSFHIQVTSKVTTQGRDENGPVLDAHASTFVFPWILVVALAGLALLIGAVRWLVRKRSKRYANIQADLRRMEKLLSDQRAAAEPVAAPVTVPEPIPAPAPVAPLEPEPTPVARDPEPEVMSAPESEPEPIVGQEPEPVAAEPTRWSELLDNVRARAQTDVEADDSGADPDSGRHFAEADDATDTDDGTPTSRDADLAIRAAAKQARRAGDEETAARLEDSLRGWS